MFKQRNKGVTVDRSAADRHKERTRGNLSHPSRKLKLVGVTGTNGKTTTATLVYEMARLLGHKAGLLSTVCNYIETTHSSAA